jgi:hypothetical protein
LVPLGVPFSVLLREDGLAMASDDVVGGEFLH